jgi:mannan endo-1,4-beta-mannosidase
VSRRAASLAFRQFALGPDTDGATSPDDGTPSDDADAAPGDAPAKPPSEDAGTDAAVSPRQQLLQFLASISGKKTMSREHNREASEGDFIQAMDTVTGHYPAERHPVPDGRAEPSSTSCTTRALPRRASRATGTAGSSVKLTDAQWSDLVTDGGTLNQTWKARLDASVPYFQQLKDAGMAALFRPHHEMNQGAFWTTSSGSGACKTSGIARTTAWISIRTIPAKRTGTS